MADDSHALQVKLGTVSTSTIDVRSSGGFSRDEAAAFDIGST